MGSRRTNNIIIELVKTHKVRVGIDGHISLSLYLYIYIYIYVLNQICFVLRKWRRENSRLDEDDDKLLKYSIKNRHKP